MQYSVISPPEHLRSHVKYFWTLEVEHTGSNPVTFGPLADGCPGLLFQNNKKGIYVDQQGKKLPELSLYGQTVEQTHLYLAGSFNTVGVRFFPNALPSLFCLEAHELTNSCLYLDDITRKKDPPLKEQLLNSKTQAEKFEHLKAFLHQKQNKINAYTDPIVDYAQSKIIESNGTLPLDILLSTLNLSGRSLERKFKRQVGITPKLFARVNRFQASLQQLKNNSYSKLSDIAFSLEYADQSHFIREFKEFAGFTPKEFQQQQYHSLRQNIYGVTEQEKGELELPEYAS